MKRIALVTDSTADLTEKLKLQYNIHSIPLRIRFGDEEFFDGEITNEDFYFRLEKENELPQTSQPSPEEFISLYKRLLEEYQEVISIHISSGLSGTINAARVATEKLKGSIHLVDSKTISMGTGILVMEAAKYIQEGINSNYILEKLYTARQNIETLFTLNTLEYLQKGGRIGRVHGILGSLLNIKPIIRVGEDGVYQTWGKARSQERALNSIVHAFQNLSKGRKAKKFSVAHGAALQAGQYLKDAMENAFQMPAALFTQVGPVIGVHTGPGTIGAAIQYE